MWAIIGLYGSSEDNTFYRRNARGLIVSGSKQRERTDVAVLGKTVQQIEKIKADPGYPAR